MNSAMTSPAWSEVCGIVFAPESRRSDMTSGGSGAPALATCTSTSIKCLNDRTAALDFVVG